MRKLQYCALIFFNRRFIRTRKQAGIVVYRNGCPRWKRNLGISILQRVMNNLPNRCLLKLYGVWREVCIKDMNTKLSYGPDIRFDIKVYKGYDRIFARIFGKFDIPSIPNYCTVCPGSSDTPEKLFLYICIRKWGLHSFLTITIF